MRILLTNDDGIQAPGLAAVAQVLKGEHQLIIVAPDRGYSAQSHATTLFSSMTVKPYVLPEMEELPAYAITGTPADCVRVAIEGILEHLPDMVISGINDGFNAGSDIVYSGTVAAAREARFYGLPSMAWSAGRQKEIPYAHVAQKAKAVFDRMAFSMLKQPMLLNYNYPAMPSRGLKICTAGGTTRYQFHRDILEDGTMTMMMEDREHAPHPEGSDRACLRAGFETLTPLLWDPTNHGELLVVEKILSKNMNENASL